MQEKARRLPREAAIALLNQTTGEVARASRVNCERHWDTSDPVLPSASTFQMPPPLFPQNEQRPKNVPVIVFGQ